jgi:hypothetical protein
LPLTVAFLIAVELVLIDISAVPVSNRSLCEGDVDKSICSLKWIIANCRWCFGLVVDNCVSKVLGPPGVALVVVSFDLELDDIAPCVAEA